MTVEKLEIQIKRKHELLRKHPEIKELAYVDTTIYAWLHKWSFQETTVEQGLVELVKELHSAKQAIYERLEYTMMNSNQPINE